jgi:hypothetical protein
LTVTFAPELSPADEFRFLARFWRKAGDLRGWFPMLADVVVLNHAHLGAATRFGTRGKESSQWKVIHGEEPQTGYDHSRALGDALDDSIYRLEVLLGWYFRPPSYLMRKRMQRLATRIFRHSPGGISSTEDPALLVARAILGLDQWIGETMGGEEVGGEECQIVHRDTCIVVLAAGMSEGGLRERLQGIRSRPPARHIRIATPRLLRYWFHEFNPLQYHDWMESYQVLSGSDALAPLGPPPDGACGRSLLQSSGQILEFPHLENVFAPEGVEWFSGAAFHSLMERAWYLRLYLETGIHYRRRAENMRAIERLHPGPWQELRDIQQLAAAGTGDLRELHFRAFCLLRETAAAVHSALAGEKAPAALVARSGS